MKHFLRISTFFLFSSTLTMSACLKDNAVQETDLLGEWEIASAYRNGALTESMTGLYFTFKEGGTLLTNMTGMEETYQFEIDDTFIFQREGSLEADYTVDILTEDSLVLLTTLRKKEFKMILSRK